MTLKHKPDAVLLDWDDHLVDSIEYYRYCAYIALDKMREAGHPEPTKPYWAKGKQKSSSYFKEVFGDELGRECIRYYQAAINAEDTAPPRLFPIARELLKFLELNNIPYAIVSDTVQDRLVNNVTRTLQQAGLPVPVLIGHMDDVELKPHASGILKALRVLSERTGVDLVPSEKILMSGDRPDKDGVAANNAGVSHSIILHEHTGDTTGWHTYSSLEGLLGALAESVGKKFERPRYYKRFNYDGIPREETAIITSEHFYIESPATDDLSTMIEMTPEEFKLHNLRWICKRGKGLDGTTGYTEDQKLEAAYEVVNILLTPEMVRQVAERSLQPIKDKRAELNSDEKITVHLPHISGSKNKLRIGMIHEMVRQLNEIYAAEHPELNVEFRDGLEPGCPSIVMITVADAVERGLEASSGRLQPLTDHNLYTSVTIKRSTGSLTERMAKQCLFEFEGFKKGDLVILADDHVQAGSTFTLQYQQLKNLGVNVVALATLAAIPESTNLQPHEDVLKDMAQALSYNVDNFLKQHPDANREKIATKFEAAYDHSLAKVGLATANLSNREAMSMMAFFIDGQEAEQQQWFASIMKKYGCRENFVEREADSLAVQAARPFMTPVQFLHDMEREIPKFISTGRA